MVIHDKNTSDDRSVQEADIIIQETSILDNDLNVIEKVNIESILCWTYTSPYGDKDTHHAYYYAFDTSQLFTGEEWEEIRKNLD